MIGWHTDITILDRPIQIREIKPTPLTPSKMPFPAVLSIHPSGFIICYALSMGERCLITLAFSKN